VHRAAIEWLTARALEAAARGDALDPLAITLLLLQYHATARPDLGDALGGALASALDRRAWESGACAAEWLTLFADVAPFSEDARLQGAIEELVGRLRGDWRRLDAIEPLTLAIGACLHAAAVIDPRDIARDGVDELERAIGSAYRPGDGLARSTREPGGVRGRLGDHVRAAAALLTAFSLTARLPYAMLADELMQFARRFLWDHRGGGFFERPDADTAARSKPFALNCEAARVLGRLAALHASDEYRAAAVLAPHASYRDQAAETLDALASEYREHGTAGAAYGVALTEWLASA